MAQLVELSEISGVPDSGPRDFILLTQRFSGQDGSRKVVDLCASVTEGLREGIFTKAPLRLTAPLQRWIEWASEEADIRGLPFVYVRDLTEQNQPSA
jgi:hypothetical protein